MAYSHVTRRRCGQCGLHHNATLRGCRTPTITAGGYRLVFRAPGRYVFEHRAVMEAYLERRLDDDEVVHHRNGMKLDNALENLQLMTNGDHTAHHHRIGSLL